MVCDEAERHDPFTWDCRETGLPSGTGVARGGGGLGVWLFLRRQSVLAAPMSRVLAVPLVCGGHQKSDIETDMSSPNPSGRSDLLES